MRQTWRLVLVGTCLLTLAMPVAASAESIEVSGQQIKITAVVLPALYVVIDSQNQVQQIIANTSDASVTPTVYVGSVQIENLQPLTAKVQQQVSNILHNKTMKPGIIYKRPLSPPAVYEKKVLPLLAARK